MNAKRCAFITGIGAFTPIGNSTSEILKSLRGLEDGIRTTEKIDALPFVSHLAGEVKNLDFSKFLSPVELEKFDDPFLRLLIASAKAALADAGLSSEQLAKRRTAIAVATCNAGMNSRQREYAALFNLENSAFDAKISEQAEFYAPARALAYAMGISAETWVINTACSGSTAALALAEDLVSSGDFDAVLVGGADAMALANYAGFSALKVVSPQKTAPFSTPIGMNIGEGAAFWILENPEIAKARGAKIYGKIIGRATGGDAHHPTQPDPRGEGVFRVLRDAAKNAGIEIPNLGCMNAHGSGTLANDKAEARGIAKFLNGADVPATSTKSYTGHCMGATGIIEATCQLLSMNDHFIPPTLRRVEPRTGCDIDIVSGKGIEKIYGSFISANYAFAGSNAAIVTAATDFEDYARPAGNNDDIVISGTGMVSPLGLGLQKNLEALARGDCGIFTDNKFSRSRRAGYVNLPNVRAINRRIDFSGMGRIAVFATTAVSEALAAANLKISRTNCEYIGIAASVCRGASDAAHMRAVLTDPMRRGDIACFSNVTANSTAGWVSKALEIKGSNITLTSGPDCSVQALEYAARKIRSGEAKSIAAFGADEIFAQMLSVYENIGRLKIGDAEKNNELEFRCGTGAILSEGAAAAILERRADAVSRGAKILGRICGCASVQSGADFFEDYFGEDALEQSARKALERAHWSADEVELVIWSPRGGAFDARTVNLRDRFFNSVPMATVCFNTGYAETSSALASIVCALGALADGKFLWPQKTGVALLDAQPLPKNPKKILFAGASHRGNCHVVTIERD